jgi:tripartite-type tricarboxylate transporter receptor subunit TctC
MAASRKQEEPLMVTNMSRRQLLALSLAAAFTAGGPALGAEYPTRAVQIVVPFPPGNASDVAARLVGEKLSERLKVPVVVENKAGASGLLGVQSVIKAEPDGYTLLLSSLGPIVLSPITRKHASFDVLRDLEPIALVGWTDAALIANKDFPANSVVEAIELIKANPGKYSYGHIGTGSVSHLAMEYFLHATGLDVTEVPYRGSGQALTDVITGRIHLMIDGMTSSSSQIQVGAVKALAISSSKRSSFAPQLPTLQEAGVAGLRDYEVTGWTGLLAPRGTPKPIIERLNSEVAKILEDPQFREAAKVLFLEVYQPNTPAEFSKFMQSEIRKWDAIATDAGVKGTL